MQPLLQQIAACHLCQAELPHDPRPVIQASANSQVLIIGQAPGRKVHESGQPWNDPSGDLLRSWLGVDKQVFYDANIFALMPMGFCYPGRGASGDLPPMKVCAPQWHQKVLSAMPKVQITLLIGQYAQHHYLHDDCRTVTDRVRNYANYLPRYLPLPHPSPRNRFWLQKNPWFADQVVPILQRTVASVVAT